MTELADLRFTAALLMAAAMISLSPSPVAAEDGAEAFGLPDTDAAVWVGAIGPFSTPPKRIVIEGIETVDGFDPIRATVPPLVDVEEPARLVALNRNILSDVSLRAFGIEERVTVVRDDGEVRIECESGHASAGVVIETGKRHFPHAIDAFLALKGKTDAGFRLDLVDKGRNTTPVALVELGDGWTRMELPRTSYSRVPRILDILVICPASAGSLTLAAMQVEIRGTCRSLEPAATWVWNAGHLLDDPARAISRLVEKRISRVYLQLAISDGKVTRAAEMREFLAALSRHGISVVAVEGDARMVLPAGLDNAIDRVGIIKAFDASLPEDDRLSGIQYDIEPYILAEYADDSAAIWNAWQGAISTLSKQWEQTISVVVPFWMLGHAEAHASLSAARSAISDVTVMAYRTGLDDIVAISEPWLAWGDENDVPVIIALENGPLPVEIHKTYRRAETGPLGVLHANGEQIVALWPSPLINSSQVALYDLSHEVVISPKRISFSGDDRKLAETARNAGSLLSCWQAFDGLAFHDYIAWR